MCFFILLGVLSPLWAYTLGQYKLDFDNMATDSVGRALIKEVRHLLRQTEDMSEILIYFNRQEQKTSQLHMDEFHEQCDADLTSIDQQKQIVTESKFRIASLQTKIKFLNDTISKYESIVIEKHDILNETHDAVSKLEEIRNLEIAMFERRRQELTLGSGVIRRSKGLIGMLVPKMNNLAPQTKFARTDAEEMSFDSIQQEFLQVRTQANQALGEQHPLTRIVESLAQLTQEKQTGSLEHINQIVDMLASVEKDLGNTNILLYNTENEKQELHERLLDEVSAQMERVEAEIEELERMMEEMSQQISDYQAEIDSEVEHQESLQQGLDDYISAHELTMTNHQTEVQEKVMRIKLIRMLKEDLLKEFDASRRYLLSSRFHFRE